MHKAALLLAPLLDERLCVPQRPNVRQFAGASDRKYGLGPCFPAKALRTHRKMIREKALTARQRHRHDRTTKRVGATRERRRW